MKLRLVCCLLGLTALLPGQLSAQTPATPAPADQPSPGGASKLATLEATYLENLRKLHAPVLQDYHRHLELLKQQFSSSGRYDDMKKADAELAKVKQIMSSTGVLPYNCLLPPPAAPIVPEPAPASDATAPVPRPDRPVPVLSLKSSEATNAAAAGPGIAVNGMPLGTVEWKVASLPAGIYELRMVFGSAQLPAAETVTVLFCGQQLNVAITPERAAGNGAEIQIMRLGQITLERDAMNESLILQNTENQPPHLVVKSLSFSKRR